MPQSHAILAQQRLSARIKRLPSRHPARVKLLNMQSVNDTLDGVIMELNKFAKTSDELQSAIEMCRTAKELIVKHSNALIENPSGTTDIYKTISAKGPYDDFDKNGGFRNGRERADQQREQRDAAEFKERDTEIRKETDRKIESETGKVNCRMPNGEFC